jgi:uncharacterized membrane protein (UPF0127 family)
MGFRTSRLIFGAALALIGGAAFGQCQPDKVEIRTAAGTVQRFSVEVADDPDERSKGLMFREKMPMASGMFFVFPEPKHASFWMKNTPLPLDLIFVGPTGKVTHVHPNAVPFDETLIDGGPGVAFVLEINGGLAGPLGIAPGAVLRHPRVLPSDADWHCDAP